jgi:abortive infection bacteriophage resistance protein
MPNSTPYTKPALTYAQQLHQLKARGLVIENDARALHLLETISYYRLSGYWYPLLEEPKANHVFKPGASFDQAFQLYCFDRELRQFVSAELEKIEIAIRAKLIYTLSHNQGPFWYTDSGLFSNPGEFAGTLSKITQEFGRTDEVFIKEFKRKYSDPMPPSWMMLEITSFGSLSKLYKNLNTTRDKRDIAGYFGLDTSTLESWLHSIVYVRNICAHHSRFWNKVLRISPQIPNSPLYQWITITTLPNPIAGGNQIKLNNRTYFILAMIVYLLNTINPHHRFKQKLVALLQKYPTADVKAMGFPKGWKNEVLWCL